jgi:hypothetical protein
MSNGNTVEADRVRSQAAIVRAISHELARAVPARAKLLAAQLAEEVARLERQLAQQASRRTEP